ncbi:tetratricopeptide repeat protein [Virgibacillus xinjiangensis]
MTDQTMQVKVNKKEFPLIAKRMIHYRQSKVVEAVDRNGRYYYLLFYKDQFLHGASADHIKLGSHIHRTWKHGIHLDGSHPLTAELLHKRNIYPFIPSHLCFEKLKETRSHIETALIATFSDTFLPDSEVSSLLKEAFYHYQRKGQVLKAYQVLLLSVQRDPNDKFASDMIHKLAFKPYEKMYHDLDKIADKDPFQYEAICFDGMSDAGKAEKLLFYYKQQNRRIDELAVRIHLLRTQFSEDNFSTVQDLTEHFTEAQQLEIVMDLYQSCAHPAVAEQLSCSLFTTGTPDTIVHYVMTTDIPIQQEHIPLLIKALEQADDEVLLSILSHPSSRLLEISAHDPHLLEQLVSPLVTTFLENHSPTEILDWLEPIQRADHQITTIQKLKRMQELEEDPDRQYDLGELYLHFRQLDHAMDCFTWVMELYPKDPNPVHHLVKICMEKGEKEEASAYQQLLGQIQK